MPDIRYPTGQEVKEISRLKLSLLGIKKILGFILLAFILAYAIVQPWVSESIIAYFRSIGLIQ